MPCSRYVGKGEVHRLERASRADLRGLLALHRRPQRELALALQRSRLDVEPPDDHHVAIEAEDLLRRSASTRSRRSRRARPSGVTSWISSSSIIHFSFATLPVESPYPPTLNKWLASSSTRRRCARVGLCDFSFGQLVSLLGSNSTLAAVAYQVYQVTGSSLWVGLVNFILLILGSLWGGPLAGWTDLSRRRGRDGRQSGAVTSLTSDRILVVLGGVMSHHRRAPTHSLATDILESTLT